MGGFDVSYGMALVYGLLSFASPCVLPLVPAYLCFLAGTSLDQLTAEGGIDRALQRRVFVAALAFTLGFASVFVAMGASASMLGRLLLENMAWLTTVAGAVIIVFGLHFMGLFRIGFLNFEKRLHMAGKPAGVVGAFVIGLAFAFGWTPCVGPILATILMIAASSEEVWYGTSLLSVYAAGLAVPFLAAALGVRGFLSFMKRFRRHMRTVELVIGGLLVLTGIAILTGKLAEASNWLLQTFPVLGEVG